MPGRVLIVEDSATNRLLIRTPLVEAYYEVVEAKNGFEALQRAATDNPDLILLDVMMPGIDGFEVCRRLKADPSTLHIPVVILTALDQRADRVKSLEMGADDFLTKPVDHVALLGRVASLTRMKMMVDELLLRGEGSRGMGADPMLKIVRATAFPESRVLLASTSADADRLRGAIVDEVECSVDIARSEEEFAAIARTGEIDAVVIDGPVGGKDPLRLGSLVRSRPETRQAATLLVVREGAAGMASKALEIGFNDYIVRPVDMVELVARVRLQLRRKSYADQLRANVRDSMVQAVTDPLTGAYNRRYANAQLETLIERCRQNGTDLTVMMLDLDRFKAVNDTHGHVAGDMVLREFAGRLQANVRSMDIVARLGGEEFMVVMPESDPAASADIAERIRHATEAQAFRVSGAEETWPVTVSIGFAVLQPFESVFELVKRADAALYTSKHGGRNRVTVATAA